MRASRRLLSLLGALLLVASLPNLVIALGAPATATAGCHSGNPLAQVADPARFKLLSPCVSATGVVQVVRRTAGGTYQVDVLLDAKFHSLLGVGNTRLRHGWLLLEFSARDAAAGVRPYARGTHIRIVGPLLLNLNHGWTEMYPVWVIRPAAKTIAPPSGGGGNAGGNGAVPTPTPQPGLSVRVMVTPKVMPQGYAHALATAYTQPGANCTASLHYDRAANPLGALFGFAAQTAGGDGTVTWTWALDYNITGGGSVTVTCTLNGQTATGVGLFTIT